MMAAEGGVRQKLCMKPATNSRAMPRGRMVVTANNNVAAKPDARAPEH
jgi:hypothetical protein